MGSEDAQEKVEAPAARVARDIRAQPAIQPAPALAGAYFAQGAPYAAPDAALGPARRYLEFDLEQVEWVHA